MRAAGFHRFGDPDVLELVDLPDPHPGPGEVRIAVHAAGINASDWKKRRGEMDDELPQTMGYEAAGTVDELGAGVTDVVVGDAVFGVADGAAQAELAVLSTYAPLPAGLTMTAAAALPASAETAARALDQLGVTAGTTLLVNGASGNVGAAAVQLAVARGATVTGVAGPGSQDHVRDLGATPVVYGDGLADRVRAAAPGGIDRALDVAGNGVLPTLVELAGGADHVVTVADFPGARDTGVRFSRGDDGRALYVLGDLAGLVASGRFTPPPVTTFPLERIADAHRLGESGHRGKLVLTVDRRP